MIYLFPAIAASLYALGSMGLKRSMQHGAAPRRVMAVSNIAMALWSVPLIFIFPGTWQLNAWFMAVGAGLALFTGRIFSIKALEAGDLSIVAPLLGMKTVLVAILSMVFFPFEVTATLVFSAVLASGGVALLQRGPVERKAGTKKAAWYAMGASFLFAITDISVQGARDLLGVGYLVPTLFLTVGLLVPTLGRHPSPPKESRKGLYVGSAVIGFQTTLMILVIGLFGQATLINVIYSSRALWSVIVDRAMGEAHIKEYMWSRLGGALMVMAAVIMAIVSKLNSTS
jgi:drug/metabolite transporter (DMT)-like permease